MDSLTYNTNGEERLVFCHFIVGIVSNRQNASDYDADMRRAKEYGIDAFALNIGTDAYTDTQLNFAYESAANHGMKLFISFDFNCWHSSQGSEVGAKVRQFADHPAQLNVDGKVFVSSFCGDGVDPGAIREAAGCEIFFAPNFRPDQGDFENVHGAFNWMAWHSNGCNKAPTAEQRVAVMDGDNAYQYALRGKAYIAPVSPWFFTHFGDEVPYSKNWVFPSDLLWYYRWREILASRPRFVEIITWNDYGESHYVGPLSSPHTDDGSSKWAMDMPHNGWLDMAKPFIAAYKAGACYPDDFIQEERLVYWYRPMPKWVDCDATDTTMQGNDNITSGDFFRGRPHGSETMEDSVFIVTLLKEPADVEVSSGSNTRVFQAPAGAHEWSIPMGVGAQSFQVRREGYLVEALSGVSQRDIAAEGPYGIYNFNAYVGTLPAEPEIDRLQPDGMAMLSHGLRPAGPPNNMAYEEGPKPPSRMDAPAPAPAPAPEPEAESTNCCIIL
ncbi:glycosyl hydrolase family 71-domain-containing protein [Aspergillus avenaceus]|uniref:Glycosyl hydrolase family 71-domain-containing protein n=1 Tax=Aspergillus avenaceus TaxID=36643 RepID=A0A5N6TYT9_ASPAV|nr:glycosyl hydrolase family 71-domain-containing protein [Aspergillus avenaceus]